MWSSKLLTSWTAPETDALCSRSISVPYVSVHSIMTLIIIITVRTPNVTYYPVFMSISFVLHSMQAWCKDIPRSVVQLRCTQLPKPTVTVTSHHITTHITSLLTSHHITTHITSHHYSHHITTHTTSHHITTHITSHHYSTSRHYSHHITSHHYSHHYSHHITTHITSHHYSHHITSHITSLLTSHHITSHHITSHHYSHHYIVLSFTF